MEKQWSKNIKREKKGITKIKTKPKRETMLCQKEEGITLVALIIMVILLIIIASIIFVKTFDNNGIITEAIEADSAVKISKDTDTIQMLYLEAREKAANDNISLDDLLDYLEQRGIDTAVRDGKYLAEINGKIYEIKQKEDGGIDVSYFEEGDITEPRIFQIVVTEKTENSITVKPEANRMTSSENGNGEYTYFIGLTEDHLEQKGTNNGEPFKFEGLDKPGEYYYIRVDGVSEDGETTSKTIRVQLNPTVIVDDIAPTVTLTPNGGNYIYSQVGKAKIEAQITASDVANENYEASGLSELKYAWMTTATTQPSDSSWKNVTSGTVVTKNDCELGTYYLWVQAKDGKDNTTLIVSNPYNVNAISSDGAKITLTPNTENSTNSSVTVTAYYGDYITKNKKIGYGSTPEEAKANASSANGNTIIVPENGFVYAEGSDDAGNTTSQTLPITNIDKTKPKIGSVTGSSDYCNEGKIYVNDMVDEGTSGIYGYYFSQNENSVPSSDISDTKWNRTSEQNLTIPVKENGTYYFWAIDNAGNIEGPKTCEVANVVPRITQIQLSNSNIVKKGDTVQITASVTKENGTTEQIIAGTTDNNYKSIEFTSQDVSIASVVPETGVATGIGGGKTNISVKITNYDGTEYTANCQILVADINYTNEGKTFIIPTKEINGTISTEKAKIQTVVDINGVGTKAQYIWSDSNTIPNNLAGQSWKNYPNPVGNKITSASITGEFTAPNKTYYLWTKIDNTVQYVSEGFMLKSGTIRLTPDIRAWTNENVNISVTYDEEILESSRRLTANGDDATHRQTDTYTMQVSQNQKVIATGTDEAGINTSIAEYDVTNIDLIPSEILESDNVAPTGTKPTPIDIKYTNIIVESKITDEASGISKIEWQYKKADEISWINVEGTETFTYASNTKSATSRKTISGLDAGTAYNIKIKVTDIAGNETEATSTITTRGINIDTNGDGIPDVDIDTDGDGEPDINIDINGDEIPDVDIDTDGDSKPDVNIDTNGDGTPDQNKDNSGDNIADTSSDNEKNKTLNIDTTGDGKPNINIDLDGDGVPDINIDTNGDNIADTNLDTDKNNRADINIDVDGDGKPDTNIDLNRDGIPDINIDINGDGISDVNIDVDGDKNPDINVDTNGDNIADTNIYGKPIPEINVDTNGDGVPDINLDIDGDNIADTNLDTNGDGIADVNIDKDHDGEIDLNIDVTGNGKPNLNIDSDKDGVPDVNVDTNGDGKADLNLDNTKPKDNLADLNIDRDENGTADNNKDTDGDGVANSNKITPWPELNKDYNGDGIADTNIDLDGDGVPDKNIDTDGDKKKEINIDSDGDGKPDINLDVDGDNIADINIDKDHDGIADLNIDANADGIPDINIDTNSDGVPDKNVVTPWPEVNKDTTGDEIVDLNKDTNGDGKPDINIDTTGDGKPNVNIDTNSDGQPDINVDINGDNIADINIDTSEPRDNIADINIDTDGDGKPDINIDTNGDGVPDKNIVSPWPEINKDTNSDGVPDINIDTNGDGKPDINIDTNGDGVPDVNIDENGDKIPDNNIDTNGDNIADNNIDKNHDGNPDLNVDSNKDGKPDYNIDTNGDYVADKNIDNTKPTIGSATGSSSPSNTGTITVTGITDAGGSSASGVVGIYISKTNQTPKINDNGWEDCTGPTYTKEEIEENGTYYVWVKDAAGNISQVKQATVSGIVPRILDEDLTLKSSEIIKKGTTKTLTTTIGNDKTSYSSITWISEDSQIARISSQNGRNGEISGEKSGTTKVKCEITNHDGSKAIAECEVTVTNIESFNPNGGTFIIPYTIENGVAVDSKCIIEETTLISGATKSYYQWIKGTGNPSNTGWTEYDSNVGGTITKQIEEQEYGTWYLYVKTEDKNGNNVIYKSEPFEVKKSKIEITSNIPAGWTREALITINWPEGIDSSSRKVTITEENGTTYVSNDVNSILINKNNTTIIAEAVDNSGKNKTTASYKITNIDELAAEITYNSSATVDIPYPIEINYESMTLEASAEDKQSGITEIKWYYKKLTDAGYSDAVKTTTYQNVTTKQTETLTLTDLNAGTAYNIKIEVKDKTGNIATKISTVETLRDQIKPTYTLTNNGGNLALDIDTLKANIRTTVTAEDSGESGLSVLQYQWTINSTEEPTTWTNFTNGATIEKTECAEGTYYLWFNIIDGAGNRTETIRSNAFIVANRTISMTWNDAWTNQNVPVTVNYGVGLTKNRKAGYGSTLANATSSASTSTANQVTATANGFIYAYAEDICGNKVYTKQGSSTAPVVQIKHIERVHPTVVFSVDSSKVVIPTKTEYVTNVVEGELSSTLGKTTTNTGNASISTKITISDTGGSNLKEDSLKYAWGETNTTAPTTGWTTFTNGETITKDNFEQAKNWYLWVQGTDNAGNEIQKSGGNPVSGKHEVKQVEIKLEEKDGKIDWTNQDLTIKATYPSELTSIDNLTCTGTQNTDYTLNGTTSVLVKTNNKKVTAKARDAQGNEIIATYEVKNIDKTNPAVVSFSPNGGTYARPTVTAYRTQNTEGTTTSSVIAENPVYSNAKIRTKVTVKDDGGSGLKTIKYGWNQSSTSAPATNTMHDFSSEDQISKEDINSEGTWYLWIYLLDYAGNTSTTHSNAFNVQNGTITISANKTSWTNQDVRVTPTYAGTEVHPTNKRTLTATGTNGVDYIKNGTTYIDIKTNAKTVTAEATDSSGLNKSTATYTVNNIDKSVPTVSITGTNGGNIALPTTVAYSSNNVTGTKTTSNAKIATILTTTETGGSGIKSQKYAWVKDSTNAPSSYTADIISGENIEKTDCTAGTYYLWARIEDYAGGIQTINSGAYVVAEAPIPLIADKTDWTNTNVTISLNTSYPTVLSENRAITSNATSTQYTINGTTSIVAKGNQKVTFIAKDVIGNQSTSTYEITNIDKTSPTIPESAWQISGITKSQFTAKLNNIQDPASGLNRVEWFKSTDGTNFGSKLATTNLTGTTASPEYTFTGLEEFKTYHIKAIVYDNATNSVPQVYTSTIKTADETNPVGKNLVGSSNTKSTIDISAKVSDVNGSGIDYVEWYYRKGTTGNFAKHGSNDTSANGKTAETEVSHQYTELEENTDYQIQLKIYDKSGNMTTLGPITVKTADETKPTVTFGTNGGTFTLPVTIVYSSTNKTGTKTIGTNGILKTNVNAVDENGIQTIKYLWVKGTEEPVDSTITNTFANNAEVSKTDISEAGTYKLWILATDNSSKHNTLKTSATFTVVESAVTLTGSGDSTWTNSNVTVTANYGTNKTSTTLACTGTQNTDYTKSGNSVTVKTNGKTVTATGTDSMGNISQATYEVTRINSAPPTVSTSDITITPTGTQNKKTLTVTGGTPPVIGVTVTEWTYVKQDTKPATKPGNTATWTDIGTGVDLTGSDKNGKYWVYVKDSTGNISEAQEVTVSDIVDKVSGLSVSPSTVIVKKGENITLTPSVTSGQAKSYTYSSNSTSVATVNSSTGEITGNASGTATITVTATNYDNTTSSTTCAVTIVDCTFTGPNGTYAIKYENETSSNATLPGKATITPTSGVTAQYVWGTTNENPPTSGWTSYTSGNEVTTNVTDTTSRYLWIKLSKTGADPVYYVSNEYKISSGKITLTPNSTAPKQNQVQVTIGWPEALTANKTLTYKIGENNAVQGIDYTVSGNVVTVLTNDLTITATATDQSGRNASTASYTVSNIQIIAKYAVQIYGINQDEDEDGNLIGLTFGPAVGADYNNSYVTHTYESVGNDLWYVKIVTHTINEDGTETTNTTPEYLCKNGGTNEKVIRTTAEKNKYDVNIHEMTWEQIQATSDKTVFTDCMLCGDTKSVKIELNDTLATETRQTARGDGAGTLSSVINDYYRRWNPASTSSTATGNNSAVGVGATLDSNEKQYGSNAKNAGGYSSSHIRATLIGKNSKTNEAYAGDVNLTESNSLYSCIDSSLQNVIIPKKVKYVTGTSTSSNTVNDDIADKIWLFSEREMYSTATSSGNTKEGLGTEGVGYNKFGNAESKYYMSYSTSANDLRKAWDNAGSTVGWWLRSPSLDGTNFVRYVFDTGRLNGGYAFSNGCLAFGFCIGENPNVQTVLDPITAISIDSTSTLGVNDQIVLNTNITPNTSTENLKWQIVSGGDKIKIDSYGVITGIAAGNAKVKATNQDGTVSSNECTITVTSTSQGLTVPEIPGRPSINATPTSLNPYSIKLKVTAKDEQANITSLKVSYKKTGDSDTTYSTPETISNGIGTNTAGEVVTLNNLKAITNYTIKIEAINSKGTTITKIYTIKTSEPYSPSTLTPNGNTVFPTSYGKIELLWLEGTSNTVTQDANSPILDGMIPVKWNTNASGWDSEAVETTADDPDWYDYKKLSLPENDRTDNTTSHWANAKNITDGGESYYVWIPRYAYRITYYDSQESTEPTGYYDGYGQWKLEDGSLRCEIDEGTETIEYKGKKYIVHPAFCDGTKYQDGTAKHTDGTDGHNPYDLGEWDSNIRGFWISKYEMSRKGATSANEGSGYTGKFLSVPGVRNAKWISIDNMYTLSKNYDSSKYSHLIKNSEWGAVAYLAHSAFGRNGNEVHINNSKTAITGNGGGSTSASAVDGIKYAFNTEMGAKASTTGNIYGVYDMSGGSSEYVAAFNSVDSGNKGTGFAVHTNPSDKYATKYYNTQTSNHGNDIITKYGKVGDAGKEVNMGTADVVNSTTEYQNWFTDMYSLNSTSKIIFTRGAGYPNKEGAGIFASAVNNGGASTGISFRTVLTPSSTNTQTILDPITSISIDTTSTLGVNDQIVLNTNIRPNTTTENLKWQIVSGGDKIKIDSNGVITGVSAGTAIVKATNQDGTISSNECTITINSSSQGLTNPEVPSKPTIDATPTSLNPDSIKLKVTAEDEKANITSIKVSYKKSDDADFGTATNITSGIGTKSAGGLVTFSSLTQKTDYIIKVEVTNADGITITKQYSIKTAESITKYAVQIYGINQDEDENGNPIGLTFGPATGADYNNAYVTHEYEETSTGSGTYYVKIVTHTVNEDGTETTNSTPEYLYKNGGTSEKVTRTTAEKNKYDVNLHEMTWEQIQATSDKTVFTDCMLCGDTKSVTIKLNNTLATTTYQTAYGDGAGTLSTVINDYYRMWNPAKNSSTAEYNNSAATNGGSNGSSAGNAGGYSSSHIRATLIGSNSKTDVTYAGNVNLSADTSLYSCIDSSLQNVITPKKVKYVTGTTNSINTVNDDITDKIWLFSEREMYSTATSSGTTKEGVGTLGEGYNKFGNTESKYYMSSYNRSATDLRKAWNNAGLAQRWWLRSPYLNSTGLVCMVHATGEMGKDNAYDRMGLAFGFCIGDNPNVQTILDPITAISIDTTSTLGRNDQIVLNTSVTPNTSTENLKWQIVSGGNKIKIDSYGVITGLAAGTAIVKATNQDGTISSNECTITITSASQGLNNPTIPSKPTINTTPTSLNPDSIKLKVTAEDEKANITSLNVSYKKSDDADFGTATNITSGIGTKSAGGLVTFSSLTQKTDYIIKVEVTNADGITITKQYSIKTAESITKYAVQIYGINQDEDENGNPIGLTFGPAVGDNYNNKYVTHTYEETSTGSGEYYVKIVTHTVSSDGTETTSDAYLYKNGGTTEKVTRTTAEKNKYDVNIHNMTWEQIQATSDKTVFTDCMLCGDTKSVKITLNETLASGTYQTAYGDGAGTLYEVINDYYRRWNPAKTNSTAANNNSAVGVGVTLDNNELAFGSNARNAGGYSSSHIRATLIGKNSKTNESYAGNVNLTESNSLYSCIESSLQNVITPKKVKYVTGTSPLTNSANTNIADKIWLFSEREMYGPANYSGKIKEGLGTSGDGYNKFGNTESKYYMSSYNTSTTDLRKTWNDDGSGKTWLLRSTDLRNTYSAYRVQFTGLMMDSSGICYDEGLSFGFCIGDNPNVQTILDPITAISIDTTSTLGVNDQIVLSTNVTPSTTTENLKWQIVSGGDKIKIDSYGVITGIAAGTAKVKATNQDGTISSNECTITITSASQGLNNPTIPSKPTINATPTSLNQDSIKLKVTAEDEKANITSLKVSYKKSDDADFGTATNITSGIGTKSAGGMVTFSSLTPRTTYIIKVEAINSEGTTITKQYSIKTAVPITKYAVQIYGINQDEDENGNPIGLTFGPAVGANYNNAYVTHEYEETSTGSGTYYVKIVTHTVAANGTETTSSKYLYKNGGTTDKVTRTTAEKNKYDVNLHTMTWEQIQATSDKTVFTDCMLCGDTKSVKITLNDTLATTTYQTAYGDGAGTLTTVINDYYRRWNPASTNSTEKYNNSAVGVGVTLDSDELQFGSNAKNAGGYSSSHIRATLIGANSKTNTAYAGDVNLTESNSLYSCIDSSLQNVITPKKVKYVTGTSRISYSVNTDIADKIWLFSEREMYGTGTDSGNTKEGLGTLGDGYSKFGNTESKYYMSYSTSANDLRKAWNNAGSTYSWWFRSPRLGSTCSVRLVSSTGDMYNSYAFYNGGLAFGFCIGDNPNVQTILDPITAISIDTTSTLGVNDQIALNANITPNTSTENLKWQILSGGDKIKITSNGIITGVAAGTAVVKATNQDGTISSNNCTITVTSASQGLTNPEVPSKPTIDATPTSLNYDSIKLKITAKDEKANITSIKVSYKKSDAANFGTATNITSGIGTTSAGGMVTFSSLTPRTTYIIKVEAINSEGTTITKQYSIKTAVPITKYAVQIYGINQDEDENGNPISLTFGPAVGANYNNAYVTHEYEETSTGSGEYYVKIVTHTVAADGTETTNSTPEYLYKNGGTTEKVTRTTAEKNKYDVNLHTMTWEQIQATRDKTVFTDCMLCGDTKSVKITLNDTLATTTYQTAYGDGAGTLYTVINQYYRMWNPSSSQNTAATNGGSNGSNARNAGGYSSSHIRATLIGSNSKTDVTYAGDVNLTESNSLYSCIDSSLQNVITPKKVKYVTGTSTSSNSVNTDIADKIWLFSEKEMISPASYSGYTKEGLGTEGVGYNKFGNAESKYYMSYSTSENDLRKAWNNAGSTNYWWLRSPNLSYTYGVRYVNSFGGMDYGSACYGYGLAFGFCIGDNPNVQTVLDPIESISIDSTGSLGVNDQIVLSTNVTPSTTTENLKWQIVSGGDKIKVDSYGVITGISAGTAKVKATNQDGTISSNECTITITSASQGLNNPTIPSKQTIDATHTSLNPDSIKLKVTAEDEKANITSIKVSYKKTDDADFGTATNITSGIGTKSAGGLVTFSSLTPKTTYIIKVEAINSEGTTITKYEKICTASVTPTETSVADATTIFSTEYGKVDVIWLSGTGNTVSSTPNTPNFSGMTPVSWTKSGDEWTEDATASGSYYSYEAGSGNSDNTSSRWANAKNSDGSYFVWIPRFAYRITYYSSQSSTEPTGYYDGWGQWKASDGKVRLALDSGIETVEHGGNKYIVHPAFCGTSVGYDNGSWSNAISGFWVAKYEMSRSGATSSSEGSGYSTTFLSVPNVQSARNITIGNIYNVAKSYDSSKESHLMKNSEWGAVAYLTQSQYGRNGNEIDINNSSSYITGNGGGSTSASSTSGAPNPYNTTTGAKASTTGNVYGVYDMSGGALEYVAVFNNTDTNNYESSYGSSFASTSGTSDKYATKYFNETSSSNGNARIYTYGKIGDATKEVNKGGAYALSNTSAYYNWFGDYPHLCHASNPFVVRGGSYVSGADAGVFSSVDTHGSRHGYGSFRVVLCP